MIRELLKILGEYLLDELKLILMILFGLGIFVLWTIIRR